MRVEHLDLEFVQSRNQTTHNVYFVVFLLGDGLQTLNLVLEESALEIVEFADSLSKLERLLSD